MVPDALGDLRILLLHDSSEPGGLHFDDLPRHPMIRLTVRGYKSFGDTIGSSRIPLVLSRLRSKLVQNPFPYISMHIIQTNGFGDFDPLVLETTISQA